MNIPKKIKIAGFEYKVRHVKKLNDGRAMLYGRILFDTHKIKLLNTKTVNDTRKEVTFIHEVLHGIIEHYNISFESEEAEEEVVKKLAGGLWQVLEENKERLFGGKE